MGCRLSQRGNLQLHSREAQRQSSKPEFEPSFQPSADPASSVYQRSEACSTLVSEEAQEADGSCSLLTQRRMGVVVYAPKGLVEAIVPTHGKLMGIAVSVQGTRVFRLKGKTYPHPRTRPSPLVTLGPILASLPLPDGCVCIFFYFFCFLLLSVISLLF